MTGASRPGEGFELILAAGIGQAAAVENKSAAVSTFVFRQAAVKRETEDPDDEIVCVRRQALQFLGGQHAVERFQQRRQERSAA